MPRKTDQLHIPSQHLCAKGYQSTTKRQPVFRQGAAENNSLAAILGIFLFSPHSENSPFDNILGFFLARGKVLLQLVFLEENFGLVNLDPLLVSLATLLRTDSTGQFGQLVLIFLLDRKSVV